MTAVPCGVSGRELGLVSGERCHRGGAPRVRFLTFNFWRCLVTNPPVPKGYKLFQLGGMAIPVLSCLKCGALVLMHRTHTDWHKKNG